MFGEKEVLNCIRLLLYIPSSLLQYSVWKYLNQKPLGMQTIFDGTIKDLMVAANVAFVVTTIVTVKFVDQYDPVFAFDIVWFRYYTMWLAFWQLAVTMIIR